MMVPIPYSDEVQHPKDSDPRSDIEKILDSIAKEGAFLNMSEDVRVINEGRSSLPAQYALPCPGL